MDFVFDLISLLGKPKKPEEPDESEGPSDGWVVVNIRDAVGIPEVSAISPQPEIDLGEMWWDEGYDYPKPLQPKIDLGGYEWDKEYDYPEAV